MTLGREPGQEPYIKKLIRSFIPDEKALLIIILVAAVYISTKKGN